MTTDTAQKIVEYIAEKKQATAKELVDFIKISPQALFRQLAKLQDKQRIYKVGAPPRVFYLMKQEADRVDLPKIKIDIGDQKIIDENYLLITSMGEKKQGMEAFRYWCDRTAQPVGKTAKEYVRIWQKYNSCKKNGLIDGTSKLKNTFPYTAVDKLYYLDFYSVERFGKTKLGQLLLYAKQSQNKQIIKELIVDISPKIEHLVKKCAIDAIGFIPPTVKREVQFMKELERNLHLEAAKIPIFKIRTEVAVPQKTLSKLDDRVENARKTIVVENAGPYKNILLIDDAVGSGATINETAAQIKSRGICKGKIFGLAITGSLKGFDVISEV